MIQHDMVGLRQQGRITLQKANECRDIVLCTLCGNFAMKHDLIQETTSDTKCMLVQPSTLKLTDIFVSLFKMTCKRWGGRIGGALKRSSGLNMYTSCP